MVLDVQEGLQYRILVGSARRKDFVALLAVLNQRLGSLEFDGFATAQLFLHEVEHVYVDPIKDLSFLCQQGSRRGS